MIDFSTMPPATGVAPEIETEEQKRQRLMRTMPPAVSAQPKAAPDRSVMPPIPSSPAPMRPNASAVGATSQPSFAYGPDKVTTDANARAIPAPEIDRNVMPPIPGAGLKVAPGQPSKPASFGDAAPAPIDHSTMPPIPMSGAEKREQELRAQGRPGSPEGPDLPWWKRALDTVAQIHPIGRTIERNIPGSPGNFDWELARATAAGEQERGETKEKQAIQQAPAEADLKRRNIESEISTRGNKDEATLAKIGMKRGPDGEIVPDENSEIHKGQQAKITQAEETQKSLGELRTAQKQLAEARTEVELAKNDPNSPAYKAAQQKLLMAQRAHDIAAQNLGLHQQEFANKVQEQELIKPGGQSVSRGSAAQAVLNLYDRPGKPGLEALVRKNASQMGPLIGRVNRGEMAIGDLPPDVGELVTAMESFYALQPAVHGFRNVEFVKDFKTAMGYLERDPESFIAGMKGLRPTLESVRDEGKTSHKRIVEGRDTPAEGGGETQVHNGFEYTKGDDGKWHKGKRVQ